jgi:CBS domain-containing protein
MSQKLKKIMIEKVKTARLDDTVQNIALLMNRHQIGCVIIVDDDNHPVGIITERDIIKRVICKAIHVEDARITDVMSKPLVIASPDMRAGDAAKIMIEHNIKKMPVVNDGHLVGLVTLTDLVRTEGVVETLNGYVLDGASKRLKRTLEIYFDDGIRQRARRCPLMYKDGASMGCQFDKCMWWTGEDCAVNKISRHMEFGQASEETQVTILSETECHH